MESLKCLKVEDSENSAKDTHAAKDPRMIAAIKWITNLVQVKVRQRSPIGQTIEHLEREVYAKAWPANHLVGPFPKPQFVDMCLKRDRNVENAHRHMAEKEVFRRNLSQTI